MTNKYKEIKEEFYKIIEDDKNGKNSPIQFVMGCYECGAEINPDGIWEWIEKQLVQAKEAEERGGKKHEHNVTCPKCHYTFTYKFNKQK